MSLLLEYHLILIQDILKKFYYTESSDSNSIIYMLDHNFGISITSYSWEILRGDWFETGLSSDHNSKLTVPVPQWMRHLKTSLTLNRLTSPKPRDLSISIHSPETTTAIESYKPTSYQCDRKIISTNWVN